VRFLAHLRVDGAERTPIDPLDVFRSSAGLSSAKLSPHVKKALYGLAGMVVQRIVDRHGISGLHALCLHARAAHQSHVPTDTILEAAGLDRDPAHWRAALLEGLGQAELAEFLRGHPDLATPAVLEFLEPEPGGAPAAGLLRGLKASLRLPESGATLDLLAQPEVALSLRRALGS
jgi:hypothetical protein